MGKSKTYVTTIKSQNNEISISILVMFNLDNKDTTKVNRIIADKLKIDLKVDNLTIEESKNVFFNFVTMMLYKLLHNMSIKTFLANYNFIKAKDTNEMNELLKAQNYNNLKKMKDNEKKYQEQKAEIKDQDNFNTDLLLKENYLNINFKEQTNNTYR